MFAKVFQSTGMDCVRENKIQIQPKTKPSKYAFLPTRLDDRRVLRISLVPLRSWLLPSQL